MHKIYNFIDTYTMSNLPVEIINNILSFRERHPTAKILMAFKDNLISRYDPEEFNIELCKRMSMKSLMADFGMWKYHVAHYNNKIILLQKIDYCQTI